MNDIGLLHYFLGIEVKRGENEIAICQKKYAKDLLIKFKMKNAYPASTPVELGSKLSKRMLVKFFMLPFIESCWKFKLLNYN